MDPPPRPKRNVAGIQPACHRASPRIAADPCGSRLIARGFISCFRFPFAGVVGGNAAGAALKDYNLGNIGNTIAGAIGGVGGGQLLQAVIPAIASAAAGGGLDVGAIVGQIVGGGAGGAIVTVIAGVVKSMMASQQTR